MRRRGLAALAGAALLAVGVGAASPAAQSRLWCRAKPSRPWRRALARHVVALSTRRPLIPIALGHDGRSLFGALYAPAFSGVVRVDARTSRYTRIRAFPNPRGDQAGGAFDGRFLVWDEYHSLNGLDDFSVFAWDSTTGEIWQLGAAARDASGGFWPSPWREPQVRDGYATWTQGAGDDGLAQVHVYDLRERRDTVVRTGRPQGSYLLAGGLVAWPESLRPGAYTTQQVAHLDGSPAQAPPALAALRGIGWPTPAGRGLVYPGVGYSSLWWTPTLRQRPRRVFRAGPGAVNVPLDAARRFVVWRTNGGPVRLTDAARGRSVALGPAGGGWIDATAVLYAPPPPRKANHPILKLSFVPLRDAPPIPRC